MPELDAVMAVPVTALRSTLPAVRMLSWIVSVPDERVASNGGRLVFAPREDVDATPMIDWVLVLSSATCAVPPVVTDVETGLSFSEPVVLMTTGFVWSFAGIVPLAKTSEPDESRIALPLAIVSVALVPAEKLSPICQLDVNVLVTVDVKVGVPTATHVPDPAYEPPIVATV